MLLDHVTFSFETAESWTDLSLAILASFLLIVTVPLIIISDSVVSDKIIPFLYVTALTIIVPSTSNGAVYVGESSVGVVPSVVYLISAPLTTVDNVTFCFPSYTPLTGEITGDVAFTAPYTSNSKIEYP